MSKVASCDELWATTVERFELPLLPDRNLTLDLVGIDGNEREQFRFECKGIQTLKFTDSYPPIEPWEYIELSAVTCERAGDDNSLWAVNLDIWGTVSIDIICKQIVIERR